MRLSYKVLSLVLVFFAFSCGSKKKAADREDSRSYGETRRPASAVPNSVEEYIIMYAPIARAEMKKYKIPASITLAQGILESGGGKSELTRRANNHFGIKCHGWNGGKVYHDDDRAQECFRKYEDARNSFRDHSLFLSQRGRYAFLFDLDMDDYKGWAKGLRKAGYATDRRYPDKLIDLIERYQLYRYDERKLDEELVAYGGADGDAFQHIVRKGDTLYSISRRYNLSVEELKRYNNLRGNLISIGQRLYVEPLQ